MNKTSPTKTCFPIVLVSRYTSVVCRVCWISYIDRHTLTVLIFRIDETVVTCFLFLGYSFHFSAGSYGIRINDIFEWE
jgi:hypothetical protein